MNFFLSKKRQLACAPDPLIIYIARKLKKQATADEWKRFNNHLNINKAVIMKAINDETTIHMYILSQTEHLTAYHFS